jgi:3' terminal RNA ribose 2'-O-methyltransferase Hen1
MSSTPKPVPSAVRPPSCSVSIRCTWSRRDTRRPATNFLLQPYVNDRPYVASSCLSVAIAEIFGTALSGRCHTRPELAATPLPSEANLAVLPCHGGESLLRCLFEPLGYRVHAQPHPLDARFPEWRDSEYCTVTLTGTMQLRDLLSHVYVMVPVLDDETHHWIGEDEVAKLLRHGEGWLGRHPERELIARRYLKHQRSLTDTALVQLADEDDADRDATEAQGGEAEDRLETSIRLQHHRLEAVLAALHDRGVARVLALGCGDGTLVRMLLHDQRFSDIVGMDVSRRRLDRAASRLHLEDLPPPQHQCLTLIHGSLLYRDPRLVGYEAAVLIEVIEHLEPARLGMFAQVPFGYTRPGRVTLTIPNREYNSMWPRLRAGGFRHRDHRFEWTRAEFEQWATPVAEQYGYAVDVSAVGAEDPHVGSPTQMGIFTRCR